MANPVKQVKIRYRGPKRLASIAAPTTGDLQIGAAIQENAGQAEYAAGAGTTFAGFLEELASGNGAIDDNNRAEYCSEGEAELLVDATGGGTISRADWGATVYLTDAQTFTLDSTSAQAIGKVSEVPAGAHGLSAAKLWVEFQGVQHRSL